LKNGKHSLFLLDNYPHLTYYSIDPKQKGQIVKHLWEKAFFSVAVVSALAALIAGVVVHVGNSDARHSMVRERFLWIEALFDERIDETNRQLLSHSENSLKIQEELLRQIETLQDIAAKQQAQIGILRASIDPSNFRWEKIKRVRKAVQDTIKDFGYVVHMNTQQITDYATAVVDFGEAYDVPISLVLAVTRKESGFNYKAVSSANAEGLMQMIPATAEDVSADVRQSHYSMFKIKDSVRFGTYYLMTLLDRYDRNTERALQAYNCGPTCVSRVLAGQYEGFPQETQTYVRMILSECADKECRTKGFLKYYQDKGL
jgi:hypothetical protein